MADLRRSPARLFLTRLAVFGLTGVTASCAVQSTGAPTPTTSAARSAPASVPGSGSASPHPSPTPSSGDQPDPSFGVDHVTWPGTMRGAKTLLNALPKTVAGQTRTANTDPHDKYEAQLDYGRLGMILVSGERMTRDTPSGKKMLLSANNLLAVNFGLGLACAKGSYRGTAPHPAYPGGGPDVTRKPLTKSVWFSCRVDGAEGDETYTGQAVGWTIGQTAWLVVAHNPVGARSLTTALRRSAR